MRKSRVSVLGISSLRSAHPFADSVPCLLLSSIHARSGGYLSTRMGPGSHGGPPPQNMLPGTMIAPVMMGAPGIVSAPSPQSMAPGMVGRPGSSGPLGGRPDAPLGHTGGRLGGVGRLGSPLGQATGQYSVERPAPNMPNAQTCLTATPS